MKNLRDENLLFLKALIKNPRRMGAIVPSSEALGLFMSRYVTLETAGFVVEIGAGTGRLTKALLEMGLDPARLVLVEFNKELCQYLRRLFPKLMVIEGNACHLAEILPAAVIGQVQTVISGIPLMNFTEAEKEQLVKSCLEVMITQGQLIQFTYGPLSPLPSRRLGLKRERLGAVFNNFPPAMVWRYVRHETPLIKESLEKRIDLTFQKIRRKLTKG